MTDPGTVLVHLLVLVLVLLVYFIPSFVAVHRKHQQAAPIFLLNLCLGWTFLGWFVALMWSVSAVHHDVVESNNQ